MEQNQPSSIFCQQLLLERRITEDPWVRWLEEPFGRRRVSAIAWDGGCPPKQTLNVSRRQAIRMQRGLLDLSWNRCTDARQHVPQRLHSQLRIGAALPR